MSQEQKTTKSPTFPELTQKFKYFRYLNQKIAAIIIGIVGFVFYYPSINGEYALDDGIIIHQNDWVIKGFKGIPGILSKDAYESFYRRMCATDQLAGGRYRPLSVVSFAVEQEFIHPYRSGLYMQTQDLNQNGRLDPEAVNYTSPCGRPETNYEYNEYVDLNHNGQAEANECYPCWDLNKNFKNETEEDLNVDGVFNEVDCQVYGANIRHFNNIWTYALGCVFLYLVFAQCFFKDNQDLAFLSAILFTMHPIHSEAIANVKSRDEIFSLIFVSLTFLYAFKYNETGKWTHLLWAAVMFLLALLSKEYAVMLVLLIPFAIYTFTENNVRENYIDSKWVYNIIIILSVGIVTAFIHKGIVNSLLGEKSKMLNRLISAGIWAGVSYTLINNFKARSWYKKLKDFKMSNELRNVIVVAVAFIVCAAMMLYIKRNADMQMPPPVKPVRSFWFFPFLYVVIIYFASSSQKTKNRFITLMSWLGFIMLFYLGMRLVAVKLKPGVPDTEILNNPYLIANEEERFCTKTFVLMKYLMLQIFPKTLSSDYSYNTITYRHFTSWDFIVSFVLHLGILAAGIYYTLKRHVLGFALMTYIMFALMIGNVLMDIGATMGERLIFHSNIGFCIAAAWFILKGFEKLSSISINIKTVSISIIVVVIGFLFGCKAWERSKDWKNDVTLFLKDVNNMPNSVLVLGNAGARWVDLADTKEVTGVALKGQEDKPYNDYNGTLKITDDEVKKGGYASKREAALYKGIGFLKHSIELHPRYVNGYLNLGLAHFKLRKDFEALYYWKNAERLYPNNPYLRNYYIVYYNDLKNRGAGAFNRGRMDSAAYFYNMCTILDPYNPEGWYNLGGSYFNKQKYNQAKTCWERTLQLKPDYADAKRGLSMLHPISAPQASSVPVKTTVVK
ncbi:MAG: tetratricopeptide repeat protein [Bacteroidetes bacterium]|nr:tetratricopeptide repeat protein [Bacteroidota bacterium]